MAAKHKDIWGKLSKVDCSNEIDKKMGLNYLSWAWAWGIAMQNYPDTEFDVKYFSDPTNQSKQYPYEIHPDGTATVWVEVIIEGIRRKMWLPVMDNRNNPIKNPNSRQVSDTTMRCLVKCLALFGLGHYIYAGEDLPPVNVEEDYVDPITSDAKKKKQPKKTSHPLKALCEEHGLTDKLLTAFCIGGGRKWIKEGQHWTEAPAKVLDDIYGRAKQNPEGFVKAIRT